MPQGVIGALRKNEDAIVLPAKWACFNVGRVSHCWKDSLMISWTWSICTINNDLASVKKDNCPGMK